MNLLRTTFFIILFSYSSYAQIELKGIVKDSSNVAVAFANVVMTNQKNEIVKGAITDEKGEFSLSAKTGVYKLSISFLGYMDWVKEITLDDSLDFGIIILEEIKNSLDEVIVTAKKPQIRKINDKLIFNVENTFLSKGNSIEEILKFTPNVWVDPRGGIFIKQQPAIVNINGSRVNLRGEELSNFLGTLNSEDVLKIEVQLDNSADLDGNSNSGVINILTKRRKGINGILRSYYTVYDEAAFDAYGVLSLNYGTEKWNLYGNYNYKQSKGVGDFNSSFLFTESNETQITQGNFNSLSKNHIYKLGFNIDFLENQNLGVEFYGNRNKSDFSGDNIIAFENTEGINTTDDVSNKYLNTIGLNYSNYIASIKSWLKFYSDFLEHNYDSDILNNSIYETNFESNFERNVSTSNTQIITSQIDFETTCNDKITSKFGGKFTKTSRKNKLDSETLIDNAYQSNTDRNTNFNYDEKIFSIYGLVTYKYKKDYFNVGVRLENTSLTNFDVLNNDFIKRNFSNVFPSFYYSRELSNKKSFSLSYSKNINRPSFNSLNNRINKINDFRFDIGNPILQPEFTNRYEISLNIPKQSFSIYLNNTNDVINGVWRIEDDIAIHQNQNFGKSLQYGVVYNYNSSVKKWWNLRFSGEFFFREFTNQTLDAQKLTSSFFLTNRFQLNDKTFLNVDTNYMSTFISSNYENDENFAMNLYLGKSFLKNKLSLRIYIDDIFNTIRTSNAATFIDSNFDFYQKRNTRGITFWASYNFSSKAKISNKRNVSKNTIKNRL